MPIFIPKRLMLKRGISSSHKTAKPSFPPEMGNTVNTPARIIAIITEEALLFLKTPASTPVTANPPTRMIEVMVMSVECLIIFIISIIPADKHTITDIATFLLHCLLSFSFIFFVRTLIIPFILFIARHILI